MTPIRVDGDFTLVRTEAGEEGFIRTSHLAVSMPAVDVLKVVERDDSIDHTLLRTMASPSRADHIWVRRPQGGVRMVRNGEIVTPQHGRAHSPFTYVRCNDGVEGYIRTKHLNLPNPKASSCCSKKRGRN